MRPTSWEAIEVILDITLQVTYEAALKVNWDVTCSMVLPRRWVRMIEKTKSSSELFEKVCSNGHIQWIGLDATACGNVLLSKPFGA